MTVYLVQHGESNKKEVDPQKGLTEHGRQTSRRIAQLAKNYEIKVNRVVHSGKTRALQTAEIFHQELSVLNQPQAVSGLGPLDDAGGFAEQITKYYGCMIVGHLPFLQRLLSHLVCGDERRKIYQFQNSGIVHLAWEKDDSGYRQWFIKWTLNPEIR